MHIPKAIGALERDLQGIFGGRLRSIVAYGFRARADGHGDDGHAHDTPLAHTLVVVDQLTTDDLRACAGRVGSWHDAGLDTPLILAEHEFGRSLDAFPFEFGDILSDHVVVSGSNPFEGLSVDPADLRRACEVQARGHLLHLREGYMETRGRADALAVMIVRSAPAFTAIVTSVARLKGKAPKDAGAAARLVDLALDLPATTSSDVVALVGVREISSADAERLFPSYLAAVERLVNHVDLWTDA